MTVHARQKIPLKANPGSGQNSGQGLRQEIRQGQHLVLTPQLLQALSLLPMTNAELLAFVETELERNPLLERAEEPVVDFPSPVTESLTPLGAENLSSPESLSAAFDAATETVFPDTEGSPVETCHDGFQTTSSVWHIGGSDEDDGHERSLTADISLHEHLIGQLDLATRNPFERFVGRHLIDAIDENGYWRDNLPNLSERLGASLALTERVLATVQSFDPMGVGARTLQECLKLQLLEKNRFDPAMAVLLEHLPLVAARDRAALKALCGVDDEDLTDMFCELRALEPKPGRAFGGAVAMVAVPDVFVRALPNGAWRVELNTDVLPRVLVNERYVADVRADDKSEAQIYLHTQVQNAQWLTRNLEQRAQTILRVATEIVTQQDAFFAHGLDYLKPLTLRPIAEALDMHESTVSRITSNKIISCPRGVFEMKYFFTNGIAGCDGTASHSAETVRQKLKKIIDCEPSLHPHSDDTLVSLLKKEGIEIARRTVTKYREALNLPSSVQRRRDKKQFT
jgi:RNA polymerase sigma-54 factor